MGDVHAPTLMAAIVDGTRGAAAKAASSSLVAERKIFRGRHTEYWNTPSRAHGICCKVCKTPATITAIRWLQGKWGGGNECARNSFSCWAGTILESRRWKKNGLWMSAAGYAERWEGRLLLASICSSRIERQTLCIIFSEAGLIQIGQLCGVSSSAIGMILVVERQHVKRVEELIKKYYDCYEIGKIETGNKKVSFKNHIIWWKEEYL